MEQQPELHPLWFVVIAICGKKNHKRCDHPEYPSILKDGNSHF